MPHPEHSSNADYCVTALQTFKTPLAPFKDQSDFRMYPSQPIERLEPAIRTTLHAGLEHFWHDNPHKSLRQMADQTQFAMRVMPILVSVAEDVAAAAIKIGVPLNYKKCPRVLEPLMFHWSQKDEPKRKFIALGLTPSYFLFAAHQPEHALTTTARMMSRLRDMAWNADLFDDPAISERACATTAEVVRMLQIPQPDLNPRERAALGRYPKGFASLPGRLTIG